MPARTVGGLKVVVDPEAHQVGLKPIVGSGNRKRAVRQVELEPLGFGRPARGETDLDAKSGRPADAGSRAAPDELVDVPIVPRPNAATEAGWLGRIVGELAPFRGGIGADIRSDPTEGGERRWCCVIGRRQIGGSR